MKLELGCGNNKKEGFFGIDIKDSDCVDLVIDIEKEPLPFEDNSIDYIYTSHMFEHLKNYPFVLREIHRVARPDSILEIWTPYGKSNDGFLFGHHTFITETHYKHICFEYDRFYLGETFGYFDWIETKYSLYPDILRTLEKMNIPIDFAIDHMFNIVLEWGVFLRVKKDAPKSISPQIPMKQYFYGRNSVASIKKWGIR